MVSINFVVRDKPITFFSHFYFFLPICIIGDDIRISVEILLLTCCSMIQTAIMVIFLGFCKGFDFNNIACLVCYWK